MINRFTITPEEIPEIKTFDISKMVQEQVQTIIKTVDELTVKNIPDETLSKLKQKIDEEYKRREVLRNMPQSPYKCKHYTPHDNLNLTCEDKNRCCLISDRNKCKNYEVVYEN